MKTGDHISVHGRAGDVDDATILDIRSVEELPDLPLVDGPAARAILLEGCFRRAATIGYTFNDNGEKVPVMFVALEDAEGLWWDLHGHNLQIDPIGENEQCPAPSTATQRPN